MAREIGRSIGAVWRIESGRIVGSVARLVRDVSLPEDLAHEALIAAFETWPGAWVPDNPVPSRAAAIPRNAFGEPSFP